MNKVNKSKCLRCKDIIPEKAKFSFYGYVGYCDLNCWGLDLEDRLAELKSQK